jgi:hypothetical protein
MVFYHNKYIMAFCVMINTSMFANCKIQQNATTFDGIYYNKRNNYTHGIKLMHITDESKVFEVSDSFVSNYPDNKTDAINSYNEQLFWIQFHVTSVIDNILMGFTNDGSFKCTCLDNHLIFEKKNKPTLTLTNTKWI